MSGATVFFKKHQTQQNLREYLLRPTHLKHQRSINTVSFGEIYEETDLFHRGKLLLALIIPKLGDFKVRPCLRNLRYFEHRPTLHEFVTKIMCII